MSDAFSIRVDGLDRFTAAMKAAPRTLRTEMATAARRIRFLGESRSKQYAAVDTGHMMSTIFSESKAAGETVSAMWGASADYAWSVDKGRGPVTIRPKKGRFLKFNVGGKTVFARVVQQGARAAQPFVTRAFDELKAGLARKEFQAAIKRTLDSIGGRG